MPEYLFQLYKTIHPEDEDVTENDLSGLTLKTVLSEGIYNDLGFQVKDRLMILVEAQSTWSPSIVIRSLIYLMQTLQEYFNDNDINLYKNNHIQFPKPELYVIYNKKRNIFMKLQSMQSLISRAIIASAVDLMAKLKS